MYKTTSDKQQDFDRTGTHATKPFGTGRVEVLPPTADPWAAIFNEVHTQRRIAVENYETVVRQLADVNWAIRMSSDPREQRGLLLKRKAILTRRDALTRSLTDLREELHMIARSSLGERFRMIAKRMLLDEQYAAIEKSERETRTDPELTHWAKWQNAEPRHRKRSVKFARERGASEEQIEHLRAQARDHEKRKRLRARLIG